MITELEKHRAQLFQIVGFAFMTPLGKIALRFLDIDEPFVFNLKLVIISAVSGLLFYFGLKCVVKSDEYMMEE